MVFLAGLALSGASVLSDCRSEGHNAVGSRLGEVRVVYRGSRGEMQALSLWCEFCDEECSDVVSSTRCSYSLVGGS